MRGLFRRPRCRAVGGLSEAGVSHPSSAPSGGTFSLKGRRAGVARAEQYRLFQGNYGNIEASSSR